MSEQEQPLLRITNEDIHEANQLSLNCPICAGPVQRFADDPAMRPVGCGHCKTLYHKACWEQSGGACAILGCDHDTYFLHGQDVRPVLRIDYKDLPQPFPNGASDRTKKLKAEQKRQVDRLRRSSIWRRLWQWLLDQIRIE